MGLTTWYKLQPRNARGEIQAQLAEHLGVHITTAKSYLNGARVLPSPLIQLTVEFTKGETTASELAAEARKVSENLKASAA